MIRIALVGLGKMGMSHQAIINAHPDAEFVAVCDTATYLLDVLGKYTGVRCYTDFHNMLQREKLDAICIATPSRFHGAMVRAALERNLHVFCEKPFCLDVTEGPQLVAMAESKGLVNQVGYHYRFVAAFEETKRLIDRGVLGTIHHIRAEAYGPVVLRSKGSTWRTKKDAGGGCLYDYACHAIDLVNYLVACPDAVGGTMLNKVFSQDVDDEVYSSLFYDDGKTGQIAANWSDDSYRKMSTKVTVWGTNGRIAADRQEVQVYLRGDASNEENLKAGWNVRYTTELADNVWFYLRGEEYSAQIDHFLQCIKSGKRETRSSFRSAANVDAVAAMMLADAGSRQSDRPIVSVVPLKTSAKSRSLGAIRKLFT